MPLRSVLRGLGFVSPAFTRGKCTFARTACRHDGTGVPEFPTPFRPETCRAGASAPFTDPSAKCPNRTRLKREFSCRFEKTILARRAFRKRTTNYQNRKRSTVFDFLRKNTRSKCRTAVPWPDPTTRTSRVSHSLALLERMSKNTRFPIVIRPIFLRLRNPSRNRLRRVYILKCNFVTESIPQTIFQVKQNTNCDSHEKA